MIELWCNENADEVAEKNSSSKQISKQQKTSNRSESNGNQVQLNHRGKFLLQINLKINETITNQFSDQ